MTIAAILQSKGSEVLTVRGDTPVREAVALLAERKIGALPVVEGGRRRRHHVGARRHLLPEERRRGGARLAGRADHDRAGDHGDADSEIMSALSLMTRRRIRHLPVVEGEAADRPRLDRRPRQVPDGQDRGGSRRDAQLHPERLGDRRPFGAGGPARSTSSTIGRAKPSSRPA